MKKLIAVAISVLLLFSFLSSAYASSIIEILDDLDYDAVLYVKQKVDERYEELKKQKEMEENSVKIEWIKKYFVDDFGDPTDKPYIQNKKYIKGTFSNSATKNSFLNASILFSPRPEFLLYEYGDLKVKGYGTEYYTIRIKTEDGTTTLKGELSKGNERIIIYDNLHNCIKIKNSEIKFGVFLSFEPTVQLVFCYSHLRDKPIMTEIILLFCNCTV